MTGTITLDFPENGCNCKEYFLLSTLSEEFFSENLGRKSALTPAQTSVCKDLFLWQKNMAALSEPFIANGHTSWRQQSGKTKWRQAEKGRKKNERGPARNALFFFATIFCFGQKLTRGETEFSLKRQGDENCWIPKGSFWLMRDTKTILFGTNSPLLLNDSQTRDSFMPLISWRFTVT